MNQTQAAAFLDISPGALRQAVTRGEIEAQHALPDGPWVFSRQSLSTGRLRSCSAHQTRAARRRRTQFQTKYLQLFKHIERWGIMKLSCSQLAMIEVSSVLRPVLQSQSRSSIRHAASR